MKRRDFFKNTLSLATLLMIEPHNLFGKIHNSNNTTDPNEIETVHLIFKTHLDIGFTDLAKNVINRYMNHFIPEAISLAEELDRIGYEEKFNWTTGSWLIYEFLERASNENRTRMEKAIENGHIAWHGLPFTMHSELMDDSLFLLSTKISEKLDEQFDRKTIAAKMTDVPAHTIGIVPQLQKAGIKLLHIGINPASTPPDVPPLFVWRATDGSEVIVMYQMDYGSIMQIPGTKTALAISFTGDNHGPHTIDSVRNIYKELRKQFPNAKIKPSSLNHIARELLTIRSTLPVLNYELGDTWIHGVASDPFKIARFREICRIRKDWIDSGKIEFGSQIDLKFCIPLMMIAEHTWGLDVKTHLKNWDIYTPEDLASSRSKPSFVRMEESWNEKRSYIDAAIKNLPDELSIEAEKVLYDIIPKKPNLKDFKTFNSSEFDKEFETPNYIIAFDKIKGAIIKLIDKKTGRNWASKRCPLGEFAYQTFSKKEYDRFQNQYLTQKPYWAIADFGKPGLENISVKSGTSIPSLVNAFIREGEKGIVFMLQSRIQKDSNETLNGSPETIFTKFEFNNDSSIDINLQWFNKKANRLPEAMWFSFIPATINTGKWIIDKMGMGIDPKNVIRNGNVKLHGINRGIFYRDEQNSFSIESLDAPLVAPGKRDLLNFDNEKPNAKNGMHFCLYNNVWGTNFAMWIEDNMSFRFKINIHNA